MIVSTFPIEHRAVSGASAISALATCNPRFKHSRSVTQNKSLSAALPSGLPQAKSSAQNLNSSNFAPRLHDLDGKIEFREHPGPSHQSSAAQISRRLPRVARPAPQKFSPLLRRPEHFPDVPMDDAPAHES